MKARRIIATQGQRLRPSGFTLIEMMIALVVVGLLAMVAMPSLMDAIRKSRRGEAFAALSAIQQAQERWRGSNASYTATLSSLNVPNLNAAGNTSSGNYALSIDGSSQTGYTVTATGVSGTSQELDACRKLSVQMAAGVISLAGCRDCATFSYAETSSCWAR
jgi:type IV pilus assembly protein PilE